MRSAQILNKLLNNTSDSIFVSLIGKVEAINKTVNKIEVQPQHQVLIDGELTLLPKLVDVPLLDLGSNGFFMRPPVDVGSFVLLIIIDYDIQNLVLSGELKEVNADDIHSLTDAIALPFVLNPFNNTLDITHQDDFIIANSDLTTKIVLDSTGKITISSTNGVDILSDGDINLTTTGTADINLDGWEVTTNQRKP